MIITQKKPIEELMALVADAKTVALVGCGSCATACQTGGEAQINELKAALEAADSRNFPEWVSVDVKEAKGVFKAMPDRALLSPTLNEGLVIELYSK